MIKTVLLSIGIVAFAMVLMCVNIILRKKGTFRSQHIGQSRAMRERGIHCVQAQDLEARLNNPMAVEERKRQENKSE